MIRLCEFSRNSEDLDRLGREEYMRRVEEEREKERERVRAKEQEREKERKERERQAEEYDTPSRKPGSGKGKHGADDREGMKLMSNRMGERVGAAKTVKKKIQHQVSRDQLELMKRRR